MATKWFIGCSGYYNYRWKGEFYPPSLPSSKWFEFYARFFNTLELNSTFYKFPRLKTLQNWHNNAPDGFVFSAKVPQFVTHFNRFQTDSRRMMDDFYGLLANGLKDKCGCVLFQLPPSIHYSDDMLDRIIANTNQEFTNAVEFRHASWWSKKVYDKLAKHDLIFSGHSYPKLPDNVVINSSTNYYRFHGITRRYYSQYEESVVADVGTQLMKSKKVKTAFVYFNNTAAVSALNNAMYLKQFVGEFKKNALVDSVAGK